MIFERKSRRFFQWGNFCLLLGVLELFCSVAHAQDPAPPDPAAQSSVPANSEPAADHEPETMFPHSDANRWWLSGQINVITQGHGSFSAPYSGPNSLKATPEIAISRIYTLYGALRLTKSDDIVVDLEEASGTGISNSLGLAGYPNIDVVRIPGEGTPLSTAPYLARAIFRHVFSLSDEAEDAEVGPLGMLKTLPVRRLEFRAGKMSLADFFDVNPAGSDSHFQFMNWTVVNNGAWDFAADTRGYTYAAMVEYDDRNWAIRFAEALMPTVANGISLDGDLARARAENLEVEFHPSVILGKPAQVRLLSYVNHPNMGDYREAIDLFLEGKTRTPDIVATRQQGRVKYGFGINLEQQLWGNLRAFGRFGWNNGTTESFAYTEVDQTLELGADYAGGTWHRPYDKVGLAVVTNGISGDHREYLKLGGLGFLLGDGTLAYGRENIVEAYYNAHFWRGLYGAIDLQHINNPGYNQDRGPVFVPAVRLHAEF
jgi:high affinity Mn2+ porin